MRCTQIALASVLCACAGAAADIFPTTAHAAFNFIPFGSGSASAGPCVQHQVFASTLFSASSGGQPVTIQSIAFAPQDLLANQTHDLGSTTIRLGYTNATPGAAAGAGGLEIPDAAGGGAPNAVGAMTDFYVNPTHTYTVIAGGAQNFEMVLAGTPFVYDPAQGNLLVEIVSSNLNITFAVSRTSGSAESSRAYNGGRFPPTASNTTATRMDIVFTSGGGACYANCDGSTTAPVLNVADFTCFLQRFAAGESYANCDNSTSPPVLNVADFTCFLQSFAAGCP